MLCGELHRIRVILSCKIMSSRAAPEWGRRGGVGMYADTPSFSITSDELINRLTDRARKYEKERTIGSSITLSGILPCSVTFLTPVGIPFFRTLWALLRRRQFGNCSCSFLRHQICCQPCVPAVARTCWPSPQKGRDQGNLC